MKKITNELSGRPYYAKIGGAVSEILGGNKVVTPVEVFIRLKLL